MPHTNRKKKSPRSKRTEITDENGWTRVTTTDTNRRAPQVVPMPSRLKSQAAMQALYSDCEAGNDNPQTTVTDSWGKPWGPKPPAEGLTVEKMLEKFTAVEKRWLESLTSCKLLALLEHRTQSTGVHGVSGDDGDDDNVSDNGHIEPVVGVLQSCPDRCVVFGTGSMSGEGAPWSGRHDVSYFQIAIFKSILDTIQRSTGRRPQAYAQEPLYNDMDTQLLARLSIEAVKHPQGFELLTPQSLAYSPGAEMEVDMRTMASNPAFWLTNKLDYYWRNEKGLACTDRVSFGDELKSVEDLDASNDPKDHETARDVRERHIEAECQLFESFKADKEGFELPNLDVKDFPCHDTWLYCRKTEEEV